MHTADLHVRVQVPEVQPTFPVHTGKHSWVGGAPLHVIHILTVVLKRAEWHACFTLQGHYQGIHWLITRGQLSPYTVVYKVGGIFK